MLPSNPPNAPKLPNRLLELPRNLQNRLLELPNYMGCGRPSLSFSTSPKTAGCSLQTKPALGAAKLWAVAGQVFPFLPARNCRMLQSGAFAGSAKGATASPHSDIDQPHPLLRRKPHCSTRLGSLSGPD